MQFFITEKGLLLQGSPKIVVEDRNPMGNMRKYKSTLLYLAVRHKHFEKMSMQLYHR